jgi:chromosome segregation ATPase
MCIVCISPSNTHKHTHALIQTPFPSSHPRAGNEVSDQRGQYVRSTEDLKLKDIQIAELKKRLTDWENKLKQQQQLYEAVRADRNHYSKGLLESQDEIAELRKKFKIMGHQIEQLKEEIASKDQVSMCVYSIFTISIRVWNT